MAQVITTNVTSPFYALGTAAANEFIFVAAGAVVSTTSLDSPAYSALGVFHANANIGIAGTLVAGWSAALYSFADSTVVNVSATGSVLSMAYSWDCMDFRASGARVSNAGEITSASRAIMSSLGDMQVVNTGLIAGVSQGVGGATRVENHGTIRGAMAVAMSAGDDTLINTGTLLGMVDLGGGADTFDGRGGTVTGTVAGGEGDDVYRISTADIAIVEAELDGFDTVFASVDFELGDGIEVLTLTGAARRGIGNDGANTLNGNGRDNALGGGAGNDTLKGAAGDDSLGGGDGVDLLQGEAGDDRVAGGTGGDQIYGDAGDDLLLGGAGNDLLSGDLGEDVLIGGTGKDYLSGGADGDVFQFNKLADSSVGANRDQVAGFVTRVDVIDLGRMDANAITAGDDGFSFIGTAAFSAVAGQLRYAISGANVVVAGDVNGDAAADFEIQINAVAVLKVVDFVL